MHPENNFDTHAGTVTVENTGLSGVVVRLSGVSDASATTDASGRYSFTGLRMGNYSVEISGFDSDAVGFSSTASSTSVGVGESKIVSFDGTYLRTAGVSGQVSVEGEGLNGVMVSLRGGPDNVDESTTTDAAGQYAFASLRAGTYTVGISGWDDTDFEFEVTSKSVTVALGETGYVEFEGELLRTSGLAGRVSVGGMGMAGVTVTLSGTADATANTDASGIYAFAGLAAGDYTVTISGYDAVEYSFDDSQDVTLEMDKTAIVNFDGMALRTASIKVMVTADGAGVAGVAATLTLVTSLNPPSGTIVGAGATDADGMHTFGPLLAGNYRVDISGADDEIDFADGMSWQGPVATDGMAEANFAGMINRTGSIAGMVTADGEGMGGVTVTLGGAGDASAMTADDGSYSFTGLRRGDYTVSVTNPNADMYSFPTTSRAVSVAIGQMHSDVSFAGTMIRRSSISGQVSVEGMGLGGVMVTLSGAHDATAETDGSGQYAFAGLGSGMYTVSMANPNDVAYTFETMSADIELGNSGSATQNFTGMHTRTASISGMLYVDEAEKNDMYDDGEDMLAAAGVELALIGPSIAERQTGSTGDDGSFSFGELRAGSYQLVVSANAEVPMDYGYGGPATGYDVMVAPGEAAMQNVPFDITHTTVSFSVMLKSGDDTGDALPGAMVTLYSDDDGDDMVGEGETDEMGLASIRFAREGTSGNMVYAMVASDDYMVDDEAGMQAVMWDPQSTMADASNAADIVNLNVNVTVSGATITTEAGGGDALAGWAIGVTMGTGDDAKAVEGAPAKLDDDGMAAFMTTATAVPATYTFSVAGDQDDKMDGGEKYEGTDVMYTHDGLSLMDTMDAGTMEVMYTTQTLKVYVHHEKDQIWGYSGNILEGDERTSSAIDLEIRHIDGNGRSRAFQDVAKIKTAIGKDKTAAAGMVTFSNVPANAKVIVQADEKSGQSIKLISDDELATYRNLDENGVMGGAFGEMGGGSHTVKLCPLTVEEKQQESDNCGTFAYVSTYSVTGLVWKRGVKRNSAGGFDTPDAVFVPGQKVSLEAVEGKNLAGEDETYTTSEKDTRTKAQKDAGADNPTHQFSFKDVAAGVYKLSIPARWQVKMGGMGATALVGNAFNPLDGDVELDVTPTTATVYGRVIGEDKFPLDSVTVTVNGKSDMTDAEGRYIVEGVSAVRNKVFISASRPGFDDADVDSTSVAFAANSVTPHNVALDGTAEFATVGGTVVLFGSTTPVAGVEIRVDENAPMNKNAKSKGATTNDIYETGKDGTYSIRVPAKTGTNSRISAHKRGFTFTPAHFDLSTPDGTSISGIGFQAVANSTIRGRVVAPEGGPLAGVEVTATGPNRSDTNTTGVTGTYALSVPAGTYTMSANKKGYTVTPPASGASVTIGLGQTVSFGDFSSTKDPDAKSDDATLRTLSVSPGTLDPAFASDVDEYTADVGVDVEQVTVTATANDDDADVKYGGDDADDETDGHQVTLGAAGTKTNITVTVTAEDETTMVYTVTVSRDDGLRKPSAPTNIKVTSKDQGATVTWDAPFQLGSSALEPYQWEASADGQLTQIGKVAADAEPLQADVEDLTNGVAYTFSVYAVNTQGRSPAATATGKAMPTITLTIDNFTIAEGDETTAATATVKVSNPSIEPITVTVKEVVATGAKEQLTITNPTIVIAAGSTTAAATTTITAFDDEVDDDDENASVKATSDDATDAAAQEITITDDDEVPGAPRSLTATAGDKKLTVEWISPDDNGSSPITHYVYRHTTTTFDGDKGWKMVTGGPGARTVTIGNLTNDTAVNVEVRAVSAAGPGDSANGSGTPTG